MISKVNDYSMVHFGENGVPRILMVAKGNNLRLLPIKDVEAAKLKESYTEEDCDTEKGVSLFFYDTDSLMMLRGVIDCMHHQLIWDIKSEYQYCKPA